VFGGKSSSSKYWDHGQDQGEAARQGASSRKTRLGTMRQQGGIREIHCSFLFPCGTKLVSFSRVVFVFSMVVLLETSLLHAQGKLGDPADLHRFLFILLIQCLERYRWRYLPDIYGAYVFSQVILPLLAFTHHSHPFQFVLSYLFSPFWSSFDGLPISTF
jgi:hypothetical protein